MDHMKTNRLLIVTALISMCLWSCSPSADREGLHRFIPERAIILDRDSMDLWRPCRKSITDGVSGYWNPAPAEIQRIDSVLSHILQEEARRVHRNNVLYPELYYRQYFGIVRNGRKLIYVNGFHEDYLAMVMRSYEQSPARGQHRTWNLDFWKYAPVTVCDGGTWFWGIAYDPAKHQFGTLEFEHTIDGRLRR